MQDINWEVIDKDGYSEVRALYTRPDGSRRMTVCCCEHDDVDVYKKNFYDVTPHLVGGGWSVCDGAGWDFNGSVWCMDDSNIEKVTA